MSTHRFFQDGNLLYAGDGTAPAANATNGWPDAWRLALWLPGWDRASTWGQDMGSWWAQVIPNGTHWRDEDSAGTWVSGVPVPIVTLEALVTRIAAVTGAPTATVWQALTEPPPAA